MRFAYADISGASVVRPKPKGALTRNSPRGVARLLMQHAEEAARGAGRTLLTLDTRADDAGEPLYRSMGWTEAGRIPGFALNADRTLCDTVLFWKVI